MKLREPFVKLCVIAFNQKKNFISCDTKDTKKHKRHKEITNSKNTAKSFVKLREPFVKLCVTASLLSKRAINEKIESYYTKDTKKHKRHKEITISKNMAKSFVKLREPFVKLCVIAFNQKKSFISCDTKCTKKHKRHKEIFLKFIEEGVCSL